MADAGRDPRRRLSTRPATSASRLSLSEKRHPARARLVDRKGHVPASPSVEPPPLVVDVLGGSHPPPPSTSSARLLSHPVGTVTDMADAMQIVAAAAAPIAGLAGVWIGSHFRARR